MRNISKDWTQTERMFLIQKIAAEMTLNGYTLHGAKLLDVQDRIIFLTSESKEFLEANRETIINGHKIL